MAPQQHRIFAEPELVLASHNAGKFGEIAQARRPAHATSAADHDVPESRGNRQFSGNALLKARHTVSAMGKLAIADDPDLVVPVLNGAPGPFCALGRTEPRFHHGDAEGQQLAHKPAAATGGRISSVCWRCPVRRAFSCSRVGEGGDRARPRLWRSDVCRQGYDHGPSARWIRRRSLISDTVPTRSPSLSPPVFHDHGLATASAVYSLAVLPGEMPYCDSPIHMLPTRSTIASMSAAYRREMEHMWPIITGIASSSREHSSGAARRL